MSEGSEAKKHKASDTKLRKQREKGSVASSAESSGFLACGFGVAVAVGIAPLIWSQMQTMITSSLDVFVLPFEEARNASLSGLGRLVMMTILPILAITLITAFITAIIYNKGFIFAMKPVAPQLKRISPGAGFKRIYGRRGLIETPVSAMRIFLWLGFAGAVGVWPFIALLRQWTCREECMVTQIQPIIQLLIFGAILVFILAAIADMMVQKKVFLGEQKMTETEQKKERKDQHGTPEVRQERRRLMREMNVGKREAKASNATMCFYFGDQAIGIEFRPPDVVAPFVVVKTHTLKDTKKLRRSITQKGWPEMESERLTRAGIGRNLGDPLDESSYEAFIAAVHIMFDM